MLRSKGNFVGARTQTQNKGYCLNGGQPCGDTITNSSMDCPTSMSSTDMQIISGKSVRIEELDAALAELQATTEREMNAATTALEQSMAETLNSEKEASGLKRQLHDLHVQVSRSSFVLFEKGEKYELQRNEPPVEEQGSVSKVCWCGGRWQRPQKRWHSCKKDWMAARRILKIRLQLENKRQVCCRSVPVC